MNFYKNSVASFCFGLLISLGGQATERPYLDQNYVSIPETRLPQSVILGSLSKAFFYPTCFLRPHLLLLDRDVFFDYQQLGRTRRSFTVEPLVYKIAFDDDPEVQKPLLILEHVEYQCASPDNFRADMAREFAKIWDGTTKDYYQELKSVCSQIDDFYSNNRPETAHSDHSAVSDILSSLVNSIQTRLSENQERFSWPRSQQERYIKGLSHDLIENILADSQLALPNDVLADFYSTATNIIKRRFQPVEVPAENLNQFPHPTEEEESSPETSQ